MSSMGESGEHFRAEGPPDWALALPADLLLTVFRCLSSAPDRRAFASTCIPWRTAVVSQLGALVLPWPPHRISPPKLPSVSRPDTAGVLPWAWAKVHAPHLEDSVSSQSSAPGLMGPGPSTGRALDGCMTPADDVTVVAARLALFKHLASVRVRMDPASRGIIFPPLSQAQGTNPKTLPPCGESWPRARACCRQGLEETPTEGQPQAERVDEASLLTEAERCEGENSGTDLVCGAHAGMPGSAARRARSNWEHLDMVFQCLAQYHPQVRLLSLACSGSWEQEGRGVHEPRPARGDPSEPEGSEPPQESPAVALSQRHRSPKACGGPLFRMLLSCSSLVELHLDLPLCPPTCAHACSPCCQCQDSAALSLSRQRRSSDWKRGQKGGGSSAVMAHEARKRLGGPAVKRSCSFGERGCRLLPAWQACALSELRALRSLRILRPIFQCHTLEPLASLSALSSLCVPVHPGASVAPALRCLRCLEHVELRSLCTGHSPACSLHGSRSTQRGSAEGKASKCGISSGASPEVEAVMPDACKAGCNKACQEPSPSAGCGQNNVPGTQEREDAAGEHAPPVPEDENEMHPLNAGRSASERQPLLQQGQAWEGLSVDSVIWNMKHCKGLRYLSLASLPTLPTLPCCLSSLSGLETLSLCSLPQLRVLPLSLSLLPCLATLQLSALHALDSLPPTLGLLGSLSSLLLSHCTSLPSLPPSLGQAPKLQRLCLLSLPRLRALPPSLTALTALTALSIDSCGLEHVPGPGSGWGAVLQGLEGLQALHLGLLEAQRVPDGLGIALPSLNCLTLRTAGGWAGGIHIPEGIFLGHAPMALRELRLPQCNACNYLPPSFTGLLALTSLQVTVGNFLHSFARALHSLSSLQCLSLRIQSFNIFPVHIQALLSNLSQLQHLSIQDQRDPSEARLPKLALTLPPLPALCSLHCSCFWVLLSSGDFPCLNSIHVHFLPLTKTPEAITPVMNSFRLGHQQGLGQSAPGGGNRDEVAVSGEGDAAKGDKGGDLKGGGSQAGARGAAATKESYFKDASICFDEQLAVLLQLPSLSQLELISVPLAQSVPSFMCGQLKSCRIRPR